VSPSTRAHLHLLALTANALHDPAVLAKLEARAGEDALLPEIARVEAALAARQAGGRTA
jgi:PTS system nitrogen regulatory IIA component